MWTSSISFWTCVPGITGYLADMRSNHFQRFKKIERVILANNKTQWDT